MYSNLNYAKSVKTQKIEIQNDIKRLRSELERCRLYGMNKRSTFSVGGGPDPNRGGTRRKSREFLRSLGLSTAHNWRKKRELGKLNIYLDGSLMKVSKPKPSYVNKSGGGIRGRITGFSVGSRRRLMRMLSTTQKNQLPVFVTLTYPAVWPGSPEIWKKHLQNFIKRLAYKFPGVAGVWKLEPQKRGAPHYHLLVWGVDYADLLGFVPKKWYQVVGSGDERHLRAGTRVEKVRKWKGVMSYASKYLGKEVQGLEGWEAVGRYWGVFCRLNVPWAALLTVDVTYKQACQFMRYMRRYANLKSRDYKSLTIHVGNSEFWFNNLHRLL